MILLNGKPVLEGYLKEILDEEIKRKADILNNNYVYQEYLNSMNDFNDEISMSSKMIEKYVEEKV